MGAGLSKTRIAETMELGVWWKAEGGRKAGWLTAASRWHIFEDPGLVVSAWIRRDGEKNAGRRRGARAVTFLAGRSITRAVVREGFLARAISWPFCDKGRICRWAMENPEGARQSDEEKSPVGLV